MRTCPLCETSVPGSSCEVCGHVFAVPADLFAAVPGSAGPEAAAAASAPGVPPLELEPTRFAAAPTSAVPVASLVEMEPTRFAAAAAPPAGAVPELDLEATRAVAAPDVVAGGLPGFERGREAEEERTPQPSGPAPCRYCRHVQAQGRICDLCGMRLPVRPAEFAAAAVAAVPEGLVRCRACFERTPRGGRCANCGAVLAVAS